jgi:hypothetical protein
MVGEEESSGTMRHSLLIEEKSKWEISMPS